MLPNLAVPEEAFATMAQQHVPVGLGGVVLAAGVAVWRAWREQGGAQRKGHGQALSPAPARRSSGTLGTDATFGVAAAPRRYLAACSGRLRTAGDSARGSLDGVRGAVDAATSPV